MQDIALVIPVLNDLPALGRLLRTVRGWAEPPAEIVVVAATSDADVETLCGEHHCRLLHAQACRGAQLDAGAGAASVELLWFLHADSIPRETGPAAIRAALAAGAEAGYFRFEFDGARRLRQRVIEALVRWRTRCGGIPYGDQGLWMTREAYQACGGFPHEPLFEEVRLVKRLRARKPLAALDEPLAVSPRRWERDGWWLRSAANRVLAIGHALGLPTTWLAARYHRSRSLAEHRGR